MMVRALPVLHDPPSLSKSALLLSPCIAWAGPLAQWYDEDRVDDNDTTKRDNGTWFHREMDGHSKGHGISLVNTEVDRLIGHATQWYDNHLVPRCQSIRSEVAVSIHWEDGKAELLDVVDREYPQRPGWQNGTADLACILNDGTLLVADWKTGGTEGAESQLLSLACGLQKCMTDFNGDSETSRNVRIACLQVNEEGVWPHEREVSQQELDNHWDAMRFQWEDIGKRNDPVSGIHCTTLYCPHLAYCKAVTDGVRSIAAEAPPPTSVSGGPLIMGAYTDEPKSDREAGETMAMVSAAKRQIKYIEAGMKAHIKKGGRVTADGYEWAEGGNGFRWRKV